MVRFRKGKEETSQNTSIEFIETLKANIEMVREMAYTNETNQKESQKYYHDRKSVVREFEVGDFVLVFRPIKRSKLENQWQGYILRKNEDRILVEEKKTSETNQILQEAREHLKELRNELKTSRMLL